MPYETLPARLREIIPARNGQEIFRQTFNSQLAAGKTEEVAYASAWSALQRAGYERNEEGKWVEKTQPTAAQVHVNGPMNDEDDEEKGRKKPKDYRKRQMHDDAFTTPELTGIADADEDEDDDEDSGDSSKDLLETAISAIIETVMEYSVTKSANVLKLDAERRIAWGWASVSTVKGELVTDLQGDTITPSEMEKMADRFMASARTAKAMHEGAQTGEVLHSFPLTAELSKAFGLNADREGWIIGMKVHDDETWKGFVEGRYKGFSIGGKGRRKPKDDTK